MTAANPLPVNRFSITPAIIKSAHRINHAGIGWPGIAWSCKRPDDETLDLTRRNAIDQRATGAAPNHACRMIEQAP